MPDPLFSMLYLKSLKKIGRQIRIGHAAEFYFSLANSIDT